MRDSERPGPPDADVRVHLTTGHKTLGDALFAAADATKRAAPAAALIARHAVQVGLGLVVVLVVLCAILMGGVLLYDHHESQERAAKEAQEAAEKAQAATRAEAVSAIKRRAVLDLLDPGTVPMLCLIPGEAIGRQLVALQQGAAPDALGPCFGFGVPCLPFRHDCTPATRLETEAWDRAFQSAPAAQKLAAARRAVVGSDQSPRVTFVDVETGQLYTVDRSELGAALRSNPNFLPATPKQVAAWEAVEENAMPSLP